MRGLILALALACAFVGVRQWRRQNGYTSCGSTRADALKVLFIGNSHTFMNDLPETFCALSSEARPMKVHQVVAGGISLRGHFDAKEAARAIREDGPWDVVVLQERSDIHAMLAQFSENVGLFDPLIKSAHARTAIYEVWPRLSQDADQVHSTYLAVASTYGALLIQAGPAWTEAHHAHPELDLLASDNHHASPIATYLVACVFYGTLLGKSPEGLPVLVDLDARTAEDLQRIAWHHAR